MFVWMLCWNVLLIGYSWMWFFGCYCCLLGVWILVMGGMWIYLVICIFGMFGIWLRILNIIVLLDYGFVLNLVFSFFCLMFWLKFLLFLRIEMCCLMLWRFISVILGVMYVLWKLFSGIFVFLKNLRIWCFLVRLVIYWLWRYWLNFGV